MWGKSGEKSWASSTTLVAAGTEITGDICFRGHLEIEGKVTGNIIAEAGQQAVVRVMAEGCVMGEIDAPTVVLNGKVVGNVYSSEHVELAAKALVDGNVHYNLVEIMRGAEVNGNLVHQAAATTAADKKSAGGPYIGGAEIIGESTAST
jgi:cytoskeletal protein CcmA (bactofilin family)